ncbi:MAG: exodeoxyribonuclease VII large subunit [Clostridiales bacterium]|uniref:exodeoxyribonuclease VII large subunit n=1 Tax=Terrisporobacter sp. TaxID=1965305 RepID=UPI002A547C22|nr:exodeoxyribonuclease VII large subunit [Terrisporobacter sp.]MCI5628223.1 exodeoxyribonuclease VII large subunit [Clostridium sp.]MDD7754990.1 exodeoxyribonuclease VII large subunit [Clostridiales bacterium]MDY4133805.1 exodeoxyribonuclease VII large subunit [Terrisporobacter sp.]MDY6154418.1 exodeoxyribonuclease VII large subunit [Terrisporobacter sp.]
MKLRALDISEVNSYIKRILTNDPILYNLRVKGEISNFKVHSSGNVYLSLKDEKSKLNCIIFKSNYDKSLNLDNGVKIIASGYISVYERDGAYQLYINEVEIEGIGNLYIEFNKLKEKLKKEGLFDTKYKKEIPKMPRSIGVITSPTGAVIRDIINVTKRRFPKVDIKLYPVNVQGDKSASDICEGIEFFNRMENVDTIIVGRGGGSLEELWSFNEEIVAREIFKSKIPIISAVGHETDFTICDFVSDMRAPTPSAAAEIATPDLSEIYYKLNTIKNRMNRSLNNQVILDNEKLNNTFDKINNYMKNYIVRDKVIQLDQIYDKIKLRLEQKLETSKEKLSKKAALLHNLSPLATISRGYSIVEKNGQVINSIEEVNITDDINITLKDGSLECNVNKINSKEV